VSELDQQISDVFGLLGLLFVFVIGYFSALLPQAEELLERRASDLQSERRSLLARLRSYRKLTLGMIGMILLVDIVLFPISLSALTAWSLHEPFPTLRAGLLLIDAFLFVMLGAGIWLLVRLTRRIDQVRALGI